jgi:hypothetical protein
MQNLYLKTVHNIVCIRNQIRDRIRIRNKFQIWLGKENREGRPQLTVKTEVNEYCTLQIKGVLLCRAGTRDFCLVLAALVNSSII